MADLKSLAESRSALFNFDPRKLVVREGWNARDLQAPENRAHVEELALSIDEMGVREPLTVVLEGEEVVVKNGHCRLAATLLAISRGAEIATVPCIAEPRGSNEADHVLSQIVRNGGKPLTPLEQGLVYKRLIGFGWTTADIAKKIGKTASHVSQALQMQEAPAEARAMVASGQVSATLAAKVIREAGPSEGVAKLKKAVDSAKAKGKVKATAKHVESEPQGNATEDETPAWVLSHDAVVAALRKIASLDASAPVDAAQFIAREALIEAGLDP